MHGRGLLLILLLSPVLGCGEDAPGDVHDVSDSSEDTSDVEEDAADVEEDVADVEEDVADVDEDVADVEEDVADVEEDVADVDPDVAVGEIEEDVPDSAEVEEDTSDAEEVAEEVVQPPVCVGPCDCEQGHDCIDGECVLPTKAVLCCIQDGCPASSLCVHPAGDPGLCGVATSEVFGALIINEILTDGAVDGDPNGDGDPGDAVGDEFVELVNVSGAPLDLSGFTLRDGTLITARHTFDEGTILADGEAMVVFGGGSPPDPTPGATYLAANADDPGIPFGLSLDNDGDSLRVFDAADGLVALFAWGAEAPLPAIGDRSWTRAPDLTGDFQPHDEAADSAFSPGTSIDGAAFGANP